MTNEQEGDTDGGSSDGRASDEQPSDIGESDDGTSEDGASNERSNDDEASNERSSEDGASDDERLTNTAFHLHPLSIPYRVVEQGVGLVVVVLFAGGPTFGALAGLLGALAAAALAVVVVAAIVGYAIAYYRRFEYELTPDTFDIRSGVLARREREIPLRRIQNVDISQNVVQRALGIAEIRMETAGASGSEARLRFVSINRATSLQSAVSRLSREGDTDCTAAERFETVFEISDRELALLALVSADLRFVSLLFVGASLFGPSAVSMFDADLLFFGPETLVGALFGPLAGLAVIVVIALVYGAINATVYYGFTLTRAPEELRYQRGLLQKYSGTIPLEKVQSLTIRENLLQRVLGYASLYIETAGQSGGREGGNTSQSAVPLATRDRVFELTSTIESVGDLSFERPPKRARQRYAARYGIVLVVLAALLYVFEGFVGMTLYWWLPIAALVLVPAAAHLKWLHRGYHVGEDHVVTRNGFWVRQLKVVPYHRVQTVFSSETVFQRRRHLGTVTIDTAGSRSLTGNDARAVDVASERTEGLRERVAEKLYLVLRERRRGDTSNRTGPEPVDD